VANLIGSFRLALGADLAVAFPEAELLYGERTGKAVDKARLSIHWAATTEQSTVVVGQATFLVRYWPITAELRNDAPLDVRDPGELEQAAWDLQTFFKSKQTAYPSTGAWYSRLLRVTPDYDPDEWGVEAELLVVFNNPAVVTA